MLGGGQPCLETRGAASGVARYLRRLQASAAAIYSRLRLLAVPDGRSCPHSGRARPRLLNYPFPVDDRDTASDSSGGKGNRLGAGGLR